MNAVFPPAPAPGPEIDGLRGLVRDIVASGIARRALLLRLSRLPGPLARPHHLRLARAALDPLAHADRARRFHLPNGDVAVVWRGDAEAVLRASLNALLHLFAGADARLPDPAALVLTLRLPEQAEALLRALDEAAPPGADDPSTADDPPCVPAPGAPLDPPALAELEAALMRADVARFVRRRQVCEALPQGGFRLRWEKRTLSAGEIAAALLPDRELCADPWLFLRLTRTLDRRMLALLAAPRELNDAGPFALNLNVATILSPEFLRFDAALPAALRRKVALDLLPTDIMADPAAFLFARDFAHARGYCLQLRRITPGLLEVFPLRRIGLDLLQLRWSPAFAGPEAGLCLPDPARIVLGRADSAEAIAWGRARGITLFQGREAVAAGPRGRFGG